jgi:hypothetical protein
MPFLGFLINNKGVLSPLSTKPSFIKMFGEIDGQDPNYKRSIGIQPKRSFVQRLAIYPREPRRPSKICNISPA